MKQYTLFVIIVLGTFYGCDRQYTEQLHIGSYNVQFLPDLATDVGKPGTGPVNVCCDQIIDRALKIGDEIIASDYDIIALQEVWTDDALLQFIAKLSPIYPNYIYFKNDFIFQGPGIMLFCKYPFNFIKFDNEIPAFYKDEFLFATNGAPWKDVAFVPFRNCTGEDCLATKGAALVRIQNSNTGRIYDIVFTHLQANGFEDAVPLTDDHKRFRTQELDLIKQMYIDLLSPAQLQADNLIMLGDFNIDGNLIRCHDDVPTLAGSFSFETERAEWNLHFGTEWIFFRDQQFSDTWEFDMQNPVVDAVDRDRGLTSDSQKQPAPPSICDKVHIRPDLIIHNNPIGDISYDAQYMSIAYDLRNAEGQDMSDHYGVEAFFNLCGDYCNPASSRVIYANEFDGDGNIILNDENTQIKYVDGMQWYLIKEPGTYGINITDNTDKTLFNVYESTNMSVPLQQYRNEIINVKQGNDVVQTKKFVVARAPFYIQVKPNKMHEEFHGNYGLFIHKALGTSPDDAITILPNVFSETINPPHTLITNSSDRWFSFDTEGADSHMPQTISLETSTTEIAPSFDIYKGDMSGWETRSPDIRNMNTILNPDFDWQKLYVHVAPFDPSDPTPYKFMWKTNLLVMHGATIIDDKKVGPEYRLQCIDQTDFWGDDNHVTLFGSITPIGFFNFIDRVIIGVDFGDFDTDNSMVVEAAFTKPFRFISDIEQINIWITEFGWEETMDTLGGFINGAIFENLLGDPDDNPSMVYNSQEFVIDLSYIHHPDDDDYCTKADGIKCSSINFFPDEGHYTFRFNLSHGLQVLPP